MWLTKSTCTNSSSYNISLMYIAYGMHVVWYSKASQQVNKQEKIANLPFQAAHVGHLQLIPHVHVPAPPTLAPDLPHV